ncbi:MAG: hypothetical protein JNK31_02160, partial [Candidatus Competibacter sp.]|nr:hypothetical protein [Candidatus Competibacter sp.]
DRLEPAVRAGAGRYSVNLLEVIDRALAIQPEHRFPSVQAFQAALRASPSGEAGVGATVLEFSKVPGPARLHSIVPPRLDPGEPAAASRGQKGFGKAWMKLLQIPWPSRNQHAGLTANEGRSRDEIQVVAPRQPSPILVGGGLVVLATLTALVMRAAWSPLAASAYERKPHLPYTVRQNDSVAVSSVKVTAWVPEPAPAPSAPRTEPVPATQKVSEPLEREPSPAEAFSAKPVSASEPPFEMSSTADLAPSGPVAPQALERSPAVTPFGRSAEVVTAEQPALLPFDQERPASERLPPTQHLLLRPPWQIRAPRTAAKATVATTPPQPSPARAANAKTRIGSLSKSPATGSNGNATRVQRRDESADRPRRPLRQMAQSYGGSRSRVGNSRHGFRAWPRWGAVRNPWEAPAKTGFNQK